MRSRPRVASALCGPSAPSSPRVVGLLPTFGAASPANSRSGQPAPSSSLVHVRTVCVCSVCPSRALADRCAVVRGLGVLDHKETGWVPSLDVLSLDPPASGLRPRDALDRTMAFLPRVLTSLALSLSLSLALSRRQFRAPAPASRVLDARRVEGRPCFRLRAAAPAARARARCGATRCGWLPVPPRGRVCDAPVVSPAPLPARLFALPIAPDVATNAA